MQFELDDIKFTVNKKTGSIFVTTEYGNDKFLTSAHIPNVKPKAYSARLAEAALLVLLNKISSLENQLEEVKCEDLGYLVRKGYLS